jgi:sulfite exporter TauE/SafE
MLWSAFVFGFLGSFHCVGMCGPIVLAVPGQSLIAKVLYNIGRAITYAVMGLLIGIIGQGFSLAGYQQTLSIIVGAAMLLIVVFTKYKHFDLPLSGAISKLWIFSKNKLTPLFKSESLGAPFLIGLINGLLPCGLVYAALFAAVAMGGMLESSLYMFVFGLGTTPLLIALAVFGNFLSPAIRARFNKVVPYFLALVAVLIILRGLNLGIPYVSPKMDGDKNMHHKMHSSLADPTIQNSQGLFKI